tara:strand:+ start:2297 stop:2596 length:300 start_codon:yes stop_codon:yes gene_type:complete
MLSLLFLTAFARADISISIVNNTRFEFDIGAEVKPYISNEVALNPHDFGSVLDKNKFRVGIRHKTNDYIKFDPHIFIQNQRKNNWVLEFGPTLRIDVNF